MQVRALREHDHCEYFNTSNCLSRKNIGYVVKLCYAFDVKSHTMHYNRRMFYCIGTIGSFQHYDCCQASQRTRRARRNESSGCDFVPHLKLPVRPHCQRGKSCFFLNMPQAIWLNLVKIDGKANVFNCKKKSQQSISAVIFMNVPASVAALEAFPIMEKALVFLFVFVQVSCEIVNQIAIVKKCHLK